jgi:hypothetical protein
MLRLNGLLRPLRQGEFCDIAGARRRGRCAGWGMRGCNLHIRARTGACFAALETWQRAFDFEAGRDHVAVRPLPPPRADSHRGCGMGEFAWSVGGGARDKWGHAYWPAPLKTAGFDVFEGGGVMMRGCNLCIHARIGGGRSRPWKHGSRLRHQVEEIEVSPGVPRIVEMLGGAGGEVREVVGYSDFS